MEFKDYYQILGVEPGADTAAIKTAYRRLARKYHPDLNPGKESEEKFKEVAEAWEVLKDDQRRAEYDELRRYGGQHRQPFEPPPGWQSTGGAQQHHFSGDFSDFFNSIFGGGFAERGGFTERGGFSEHGFTEHGGFRGQDIQIEVPVFLEETIADQQRPIEFELPVMEPGQRRGVRKNLKVKIPAGVADGERIRVRGQGVPGTGDAPAGDLYLHIRLVPHPVFDVEGHDLLVTVPVAPWEAALGAKVTVPTLEGKITLTIAAGSQTGQKLRIRGKGLAGRAAAGKMGGKMRGDMYAVLKVVMPTDRSAEVQKLWEELSRRAAFDPRANWETGK